MRIEFFKVDHDATSLGTVALYRYEAETGEAGYEVRLNGEFLMATHGVCGEQAMAELAWQRRCDPAGGCAVLVAGLGAGHTLRAALDLPDVTSVEVVEISPKVVEWNRRFFRDVNGAALDDERVRVHVTDLMSLLRDRVGTYDLLLQDVDNGPGWLAARGNRAVYAEEGLTACGRALRPGGVLALWSPSPNLRLRTALESVFGQVDEVRTTGPELDAVGPNDVVYLAQGPVGGAGRR